MRISDWSSDVCSSDLVEHFGRDGPRRILDLGTGSGALLLAALDEWRSASGVGVDISEEALAVARRNAERLGMSGRSEFRQGDWGVGNHERFTLALINPPYISTQANLPHEVFAHEPPGTMYSGSNGRNNKRERPPERSPP